MSGEVAVRGYTAWTITCPFGPHNLRHCVCRRPQLLSWWQWCCKKKYRHVQLIIYNPVHRGPCVRHGFMGSHTYTYSQACYICPGTVPIPHYLLSSHWWCLSSKTAKLYHSPPVSLLCNFLCVIPCDLHCVWGLQTTLLCTGTALSKGFYLDFTDWDHPQGILCSHWKTGITKCNPWALFGPSWWAVLSVSCLPPCARAGHACGWCQLLQDKHMHRMVIEASANPGTSVLCIK